MGRLEYFLSGIIILVSYIALCFLIGCFWGLIRSIIGLEIFIKEDEFLNIILLYPIVAVIVLDIKIKINRLNDLGKKATWLFICLIPIANIIFSFYLLFAKGIEDEEDKDIEINKGLKPTEF